MSYIGEIKLSAVDFEIEGWLICDGRQLSVQQYQALFAVIGTTYGGDGRTTFHLPDLRARIPLGISQKDEKSPEYPLGAKGGKESVAYNYNVPLPAHSHKATFVPQPLEPLQIAVNSTFGDASLQDPKDAYLAAQRTAAGVNVNFYKDKATPNAFLGGVEGGSGAGILEGLVTVGATGTANALLMIDIDTRQPYLALNYFICMDGDFPVAE